RFGHFMRIKELCYDVRGGGLLESFLNDLRFAMRSLCHNVAFMVLAVAMLALGIGLNATIFTLTNAILFKGFPLVERNDRLLYITRGNGANNCCPAYTDFEDWRSEAHTS